jgi:hypothetical protein
MQSEMVFVIPRNAAVGRRDGDALAPLSSCGSVRVRSPAHLLDLKAPGAEGPRLGRSIGIPSHLSLPWFRVLWLTWSHDR